MTPPAQPCSSMKTTSLFSKLIIFSGELDRMKWRRVAGKDSMNVQVQTFAKQMKTISRVQYKGNM